MSRILLVEPDTKLANTYRTSLDAAGHTVLWKAHAQDAVYEADKFKPDMVLLELQLAAHNGIEFLYEFRSYVDWQKIPVVLLTMVQPHALQITPQNMEMLGIVRCLYKPATTLQQLRRAVNEATLVSV
jgi:DNA-binding response OmpR family regulator